MEQFQSVKLQRQRHWPVMATFLTVMLSSLDFIAGVRVADIILEGKVTPPAILLDRRPTQGFKVANILESERLATLPMPTPGTLHHKMDNETVTGESSAGEASKFTASSELENNGGVKTSGVYDRYPLITLTDSYNKDIPPRPKEGGPVQVDFYILLVDIRDINEVEEELVIEYNLQIFWKDERLTQWDRNSSIFKNAKEKRIKYEVLSPTLLSDIWIPDTFIDYVKQMDQHQVLSTPASLRVYFKDGTFRFSGRFTTKIACQMDFHYYPADTQRCPVNIKSYAYDNGTVFVNWRDGKEPAMRGAIALPNFRVAIGGALSNKIQTTSNTYSEIKFIVILRRLLGFHMIQTYLPSCLFVVISFLTFLLSGENVLECLTLCMTTLLTLTAMFAAVKQNTPTVSYVKGLDIWMVTCIFCVFFTLLEHTVLLKLREQITHKVKDPEKKKLKKRKSLFNLTPIRGGGKQKPSTRPSQEPLTPFYKAGLKKAEQRSSDSGSDSSPNIQLRRYPQPTPPASIHLSPPSPMIGGGLLGPNAGQVSMGNRVALSPTNSTAISPDHMLLSPLTPQFASMLSKKASKRFKLSKTVEKLFSNIIPISFLLFNVIYWPWLLNSADFYNDEPFQKTKYV